MVFEGFELTLGIETFILGSENFDFVWKKMVKSLDLPFLIDRVLFYLISKFKWVEKFQSFGFS